MAGITFLYERDGSLKLELPPPDMTPDIVISGPSTDDFHVSHDHLVLDVNREGVLDVILLNCEERLYTLNDVKVRDYQGREL